MTIRTMAAAVLFTLVGVTGGTTRAAADDAKRPNIIFIFSDDHAYQAIGAYGSTVNKTPNLDRIAHEGMLFKNCYVTNSLCGPMRAVIQTGKYSHVNGFLQNGDKFNGDQWTFPKQLQKLGYNTAVIGKWHLGEHQAPQGFSYSEVLVGQGTYYNPVMLRDATGSGDKAKVERIRHTGYTTDIITDRALWWIKEGRDKDKPFMLMCQNKAPHREWDPGPDHLNTFAGVKFPEPPTLFEDYSDKVKPRRTQQMTIAQAMRPGPDLKLNDWAPGNLTPEQRAAYLAAFKAENDEYEANKDKMSERDRVRWAYQRYMRIYLACVQSVDDNVGRLLKYLDESGLADNTIVVYCSDQGFYLGEHGWFDKRWVYEESLRTPLMIRWPKNVKPGSVNADIISPVDLAATFLDMAGGADQTPDDLQGRSFVSLLKGTTPDDWRKTFYYHYYEYPGAHVVRRHYAVVDGQYKLIHFYEPDVAQWELIDLKADPLEQKNFYDDPKYSAVRNRLHAELDRLRSELKVPDVDPDKKAKPRGELRPVDLHEAMRLAEATDQTRGDLDPSGKPFAVGATVTPESGDGVIVAAGGGAMGFSLYLKGGVPTFAIRSSGALASVAAKKAVELNKPVHVAGALSADGTIRVLVNGKPAAQAKGFAIASKPAEPLSVGSDTGDAVGEYDAPMPFKGKLTDLRLYWGEPDAATLAAWVGG